MCSYFNLSYISPDNKNSNLKFNLCIIKMSDDNKLIIGGAIIGAIVGISVIIGFFIIPLLTPTPDDPHYEPPIGPYNTPQMASINYIQVYHYNETIWSNIFGIGTSPTNLFGLNSDKILYQYKLENTGLENTLIDVFDMVEYLYGITFNVIEKNLIKQGREEIGGEWDAWVITRILWSFTNNSFGPTPNIADIKHPILQNPLDISDLFNEIQALINFSYLNLENFNSSEFLYEMMLKRFLFARPVDLYLEEFITSLNPQNITVTNTILSFSRKVNKNYRVFANYDNHSSNLNYISFIDENSKIFYYQGIGSPPAFSPGIDGFDFNIIMGLSCILFIGIIYIYCKKRVRFL